MYIKWYVLFYRRNTYLLLSFKHKNATKNLYYKTIADRLRGIKIVHLYGM